MHTYRQLPRRNSLSSSDPGSEAAAITGGRARAGGPGGMAARGLLLAGLVGLALASAASAETVLALDGKQWTLQNGNGSISLSTTTPAYPLEVLRANGVIGDPLYRYGEQESRWVAYDTWNFTVTFSAEEAAKLAQQEQVMLYLGGVDTFANVTLNGHQVLETNNFHRHWTVPVRPYLNTQENNTLAISIASAYNVSVANQEAHPYYIPTLYNTGSIGAYNFARKPAFDFGWDWGPAFAASGIHGTVKLIAFSKPTLAGAYLSQVATPEGFNLKVTAQFLVPDSGGEGTLSVSIPELHITQAQEVEFASGSSNSADYWEAAVELSAKREEVTLWWPAGGNYGPQKLYDVKVEFMPWGVVCAPPPAAVPAAAGQQRPAGSDIAARQDPASLVPDVDVNIDLSDGLQASLNLGNFLDFQLNIGGPGGPFFFGGGAASAHDPSACSIIRKRVGFRTIEKVTDPLPKAIEDLFGNNTGFEFDQDDKYIYGILAATGDGQWALNEAAGKWTHFPGNRSNVEGAMGESFYFKVNGVPIYLKGANVIPLNVLPSNVTADVIRATLQAAVEANQNLLRVWGGGLYHTEEFYDFCDEHGILIWQDAMFGGSHYPRSAEWIANIQEEVTQQAERLSWHPSIAVWCGNNELELSYDWPNNTIIRSNRNMFANDYMANIQTVRNAIKKVDPSAIFVSSSPSKGAVVDSGDDYVLRWGWIGDTRYGTVHHYDYMSDCENFRSYPTAKFVTEFGWQSYPMPETYAAAMEPETDWGVGNPMNEFRNRRTDVTPQFLYQYGLHFNLPEDWNPEEPEERMRRFRSYLWIGHMQHMRCYETSLNLWRRLRSHPSSLTMGVMYWQLNDIWAGASWSSLDFAGRWKPVHYAVKRAYAPLVVQAIRDHDKVDVFVVSDLVNATDASIRLQLVSLDDSASSCSADVKAAQSVLEFTVPVPGSFATRVWSANVSELLAMRPGCTVETCFLTATASADGVAGSESQLWLAPFKNISLPEPSVSIDEVVPVAPDAVNITLSASRPAALVLLSETAPLLGHFDDNAFSINPCEKRVVTFKSQKGAVSAAELQRDGAFYVESLFNHSSWSEPAGEAKEGAGAAVAPTPATADTKGAAGEPKAAAAGEPKAGAAAAPAAADGKGAADGEADAETDVAAAAEDKGAADKAAEDADTVVAVAAVKGEDADVASRQKRRHARQAVAEADADLAVPEQQKVQ